MRFEHIVWDDSINDMLSPENIKRLNNSIAYQLNETDIVNTTKEPMTLSANLFSGIPTKIGRKSIYVEFITFKDNSTIIIDNFRFFNDDEMPDEVLDRINFLQKADVNEKSVTWKK